VDAFGALRVDVPVLALWGPSAGRVLWAECAPGTGLHTYPDLEVLEVLDPMTGLPTAVDGDLTVTSAGWHGTALVRFQTGARADPVVVDTPCPGCGRTVPRLVGDVLPHAWEVPAVQDSGEVEHVDLRGVVVAGLDGVTSWRAELRGPDERVARDRLVVALGGASQRRDLLTITGRFARSTGITPEVASGLSDAEVAAGIEEAGGILADRR
jgi:hypothetical protein